MKIKKLSANLKGRDFVCGDIHGSYSCVQRFLKEIGFDFTHDRLICAGDLVDRGPENEKCMDLLYQPWFHMVKGNHEQLMEDYFKDLPFGSWWAPNGGAWGTDYKHEQSDIAIHIRGCVGDIINELPYLITVEKKDGGIFHVLHAELWNDGYITDDDLANEEIFTHLATIQTRDGDMVCWGRRMFTKLFQHTVDEHWLRKFKTGVVLDKLNRIFNKDLSPIYSGHTIMKQPTQFYGQTNLDTMAYGSYPSTSRYGDVAPPEWCGLTVTEPETGKFWLINDREFKEAQPLVIND